MPYLLFIFILLAPLSKTEAAAQTLDAIKIVVNKDVITEAQFEARLQETKANLQTRGQLPSEAEIEEQVSNQLILESLQMQMAERGGLRISNQELTTAISDIAQRNGLSLEGLKNELEADGKDYQAFRERIRKDMIIQNVQQGSLRGKVNVSEQQVDNYLASSEGQRLTEESYDLSFLTLALASNSDAATIAAAKKTMQALKQQLEQSPPQFARYAQGASFQGSQIEGANLGKRSLDELPSLFVDLALQLENGDISDPVQSGAGWHLLKMNRKIGGQQLEYQVLSRHILITPSAVRNDAQAQKLTQQLADRIKQGEDFSLLAKEYSEDPGSALQGGELGWSSPSRYAAEFANTLAGLNIGQVSAPFKTEFGWHIVEKLDQRQHDITRERQRNQARQILGQRQFKDELDNWLSEMKGEAFIEIKR